MEQIMKYCVYFVICLSVLNGTPWRILDLGFTIYRDSLSGKLAFSCRGWESGTGTFQKRWSVLSKAVSLPYDLDINEVSPEELNKAVQMFDEVPVKRGLCPEGFTYQAILRNCVPSLGVLRGRGRHGRRGRRGLSFW